MNTCGAVLPSSDNSPNANATSPEAFWEPITSAGKKTAVIHAGLELRVWEKIAAGHHTANDLA